MASHVGVQTKIALLGRYGRLNRPIRWNAAHIRLLRVTTIETKEKTTSRDAQYPQLHSPARAQKESEKCSREVVLAETLRCGRPNPVIPYSNDLKYGDAWLILYRPGPRSCTVVRMPCLWPVKPLCHATRGSQSTTRRYTRTPTPRTHPSPHTSPRHSTGLHSRTRRGQPRAAPPYVRRTIRR